MSHEAERRPGFGEIQLAVTNHDRVQVDSILVPLSLLDEVAEERGLGANAIWST